jgi:hypothetical protein
VLSPRTAESRAAKLDERVARTGGTGIGGSSTFSRPIFPKTRSNAAQAKEKGGVELFDTRKLREFHFISIQRVDFHSRRHNPFKVVEKLLADVFLMSLSVDQSVTKEVVPPLIIPNIGPRVNLLACTTRYVFEFF